jgi:hypothetical protein
MAQYPFVTLLRIAGWYFDVQVLTLENDLFIYIEKSCRPKKCKSLTPQIRTKDRKFVIQYQGIGSSEESVPPKESMSRSRLPQTLCFKLLRSL